MKRTRKNLPVAIHTGKSADVIDAVALGADSVEHGSFIDEIPDATIAEMKAKGIAYDPTLSVAEGFTSFAKGDTTLLKRSLVQQVTPKDLADRDRKAATSDQFKDLREGIESLPDVDANRRQQSAESLARGRAARDRVGCREFSGPARPDRATRDRALGRRRNPDRSRSSGRDLQCREAAAGRSRIGTIEKGKEATLLIVDGNPLQDVRALSSISAVFMKGERVVRSELFEQH